MSKRLTPEQIIHKLREAEVDLARGKSIPEACKKIGVVEQTARVGNGMMPSVRKGRSAVGKGRNICRLTASRA